MESGKTQALLELVAIAELSEKEAHLAIQFHETWRPAAFNREVHKRISFSYVAHTFEIVRWALSRELLMSLSRLWINQKDAIALTKAAHHLKNPKVFDALCIDYLERLKGESSSMSYLRMMLSERRQEFLDLVNKYHQGGRSASVLGRLAHLRHNELAHRRLEINDWDKPSSEPVTQQSQQELKHNEVEELYQDSLIAVSLLNDLARGKVTNLKGITNVYKHHSNYFWEGLRSERELGHPRYIAPSNNALIDGSQ